MLFIRLRQSVVEILRDQFNAFQVVVAVEMANFHEFSSPQYLNQYATHKYIYERYNILYIYD